MAIKKKSPPEESGDKDQKEEVSEPGQPEETKEEQHDQALSQIPEKFQGKSPEEIAKAYTELEKKFGEHSKELEDARKYLSEREILSQAITRNPELYKMLEGEINALTGRKAEVPNKESDGEAGKVDPQVADLRRAEQNRIISDFQGRYGIDKLPAEERQDFMKKVSSQFADLVDPGGAKSMSDILSGIKLEQLPKFLENSYWLVKKDTLMDRGKFPDQDFASIGGISTASSGKSDEASLTEREQFIAKRLGIEPDKYLKQKQSLLKK